MKDDGNGHDRRIQNEFQAVIKVSALLHHLMNAKPESFVNIDPESQSRGLK